VASSLTELLAAPQTVEPQSVGEDEPPLDAAHVVADAVMVDDAMQPLAAQFMIVAAPDQGRVLARDCRLVDVAVEGPGLHLALVEFAVVQKAMERMQVVIALGADGPQHRLKRLGGHEFRRRMYVHG